MGGKEFGDFTLTEADVDPDTWADVREERDFMFDEAARG